MTRKQYREFNFAGDDRYIITHTRETFEKSTYDRTFPKNADNKYTEIVNSEFYTNFVQSVPFFNGFCAGSNYGTCRAYSNYTIAGFLPVRIVTTSPDKTTRHIDCFTFEAFPFRKAREKAGFRENDMLDNFKYYEHELDGTHDLFTFYNADKSCTFDISTNNWVG